MHTTTTEKDISRRWGRFGENVIRIKVTRWNESEIWGVSNDAVAFTKGEAEELCVVYDANNEFLTRGGKGDWGYLNSILSVGCSLNLVRIRRRGAKLLPELIIYEPDILLNVTTIASCFETYAESPFVSLVNRLKPSEYTIPIHLGNLAGQFLDETVRGEEVSFSESFMRFFHKNALGMVCCRDMSDPVKVSELYENAKRQQKIIDCLINNDLAKAVEGFEKGRVVLEPTFISEVLGIQGRLDLLYEAEGKTVIVEQKSGKGTFVPFSAPGYDPDKPEMQEKHAVQLLLYRALFVYEFQRYSDQMKDLFLLYSKYPKGLLPVEQMPALMLRAIRMRNLLAWCERDYADGGLRRLLSLTPEMLNQKNVHGKLWEAYTRPQLAELLAPIQLASPLEQSYYLHFMTFIAREFMYSRLGDGTVHNPGFASMWNYSLEEKKATGNIYDGLLVSEVMEKDGNVVAIRMLFPDNTLADTSNFRVGDGVLLYPYDNGNQPDACAQMVTRATISDILKDGVMLRLRYPMPSSALKLDSSGVKWAAEHDINDSTGALYSGMHSFLSAPKDRRDLILSQRKPRLDESLEAKGEYGKFNDLVVSAKRSRDVFLIIGPPGTGKTSYGMLYQLREELLEEGSNVLLLSYTNRAVDEICSKLVEDGIDFLRIGNEFSCSPESRDYLVSERVKSLTKGDEVRRLIASVRVFCSTTASLMNNISLLKEKQFSLAIVDEASQILEHHLVPFFAAHNEGVPAIQRFVLIGDHKQLPAVVQQPSELSAVKDSCLNEIHLTDCRLSLFERFLRTFRLPDGSYDPNYVYMLLKQGRMHRDISDFPNRAFYNGKLDIVPLPHQQLESAFPRLHFYDIPLPDDSLSDMVNIAEAVAIARKAVDIYQREKEHFCSEHTLGVIVPYRNQTATIRKFIDSYGIPELHRISIDTVERYQGSQRDNIIYGFTVQKPYQIDFLTSTSFVEDGYIIDRKLNVAMTRARLNLYIFGNVSLLKSNSVFNELIEYCRSINALS